MIEMMDIIQWIIMIEISCIIIYPKIELLILLNYAIFIIINKNKIYEKNKTNYD